MTTHCECCELSIAYPDLTKKTYSMGCDWCAARYVAEGGEGDISKWEVFGVNVKQATRLRLTGELVDPELKRRKKQ